MINQIWVTPYNVPTKTCSGPSGVFPGAKTPKRCSDLIAPPNSKIVSSSKRLVLIDLDGVNGLVISDIPYVIN